ncbi:MAG: hypothetical protein HUU03_03360, partial [Planctomycetaceae bacterium]|nr:hypothetical protein [Planctomycetaceae bacterium]
EAQALIARDGWNRDVLFPYLNGEDLKALGLPPGPRYRELLSALEDEMLEGRVGTREGAFAFVKSRMDAREHGQ